LNFKLWDLRRKGCIFTYKGHTNSINSLKFSPDSKWIASVSDDGLVKIWDLKAGKLLVDLKGHNSSVNSLEFHPNEFLLATGSSDRTVKFWDLEKMENVSTSPQVPSSVKQIMFDPNGKSLFAASNDYLHSLKWEPSEFYDSVFCQWKQIYDITINSNRLIAGSFNQNTVSFYAVDLNQVSPIGTPPVAEIRSTECFQPVVSSNNVNIKISNSTRRNFGHNQQLEFV
jgi:katanin p80 WD40 repeat-containing subunit B1